MDEIAGWSAVETAARVRDRSVSITEVVGAHLERLAEINPRINAITQVVEDSLELAKTLDARRSTDATPILHGVPVTTKINVDQAGFSNSNGVPAYNDAICESDSAVVHNLKSHGAIVIGRTNTPEFSMRWCTSNPVHGVSTNPWDARVTPGGSSGAAAAAVATGIGALAHGNDLGGSLRYPAFCCGVASIRPSLGRIPAFNPGAKTARPPITQTMSVQGPIARSIGDVRLGLQAMSARSPSDPLWTAASSSGRKRTDEVTVGCCTNPFTSDIDPALVKAMETARTGLRDAGIKVVETIPPEAEHAAKVWGQLLMTETAILMGDTIRRLGSAEITQVLETSIGHFGVLDLPAFLTAMQERLRLQKAWSEMFENVDLLMMPTSLQRPFENDLDFKQPQSIPSILEAQKPLYVVNLLGLPAVALPTNVVDGLPLGVQLVAPMHDDAFALAVAGRLEAEIGTVLGEMPV